MLVAATAFLLAIVILRKPLQQALLKLRNFRFKNGETEVSIGTDAEEPQSETPHPEEKKQEPEPSPPVEEPASREPGDLFFKMYRAFDDGKFEEADTAFKEGKLHYDHS